MSTVTLERTKKQYTYEDYASTAYYDLRHKKKIYEKTGVREYWIVDPIEKSIEVHENINGEFKIFSQAIEKGIVNSKLLEGFGVELKKVF